MSVQIMYEICELFLAGFDGTLVVYLSITIDIQLEKGVPLGFSKGWRTKGQVEN